MRSDKCLACSRFLIRVSEDAVALRMVVVTASIPQARRSTRSLIHPGKGEGGQANWVRCLLQRIA